MASDTLQTIFQLLMAGLGAYLLVQQWQQERGSGTSPTRFPLGPWNVSGWIFAMAALRVLLVVLACQWAAYQALQTWWPESSATEGRGLLFLGASTQFGLLLGLAFSAWLIRQQPVGPWETPEALGHPAPLPWRQVPLAGAKTFFITFVVVLVLTYLWRWTLTAIGVDVAEQDMLNLVRSSEDYTEIALVALLACVVAPVAEEGLFRAGLFRFVRTRVPGWAGYAVPAIVFAAVHYNLAALPGLIVLAVVFSMAYERTGRIAVPMIAHALFNLNTLVQAFFASPGP